MAVAKFIFRRRVERTHSNMFFKHHSAVDKHAWCIFLMIFKVILVAGNERGLAFTAIAVIDLELCGKNGAI